MATLAIKGHPTRGKEVIEILEMLGGRNVAACTGANTNKAYVLASYVSIDIIDYVNLNSPEYYLCVFTLEEFLEKFPYKVGDKVLFNNKCFFIRKMYWENNQILYQLSDENYEEGNSSPDTLIFDVNVAKLQPYKEQEIMKEERIYREIDFNYEPAADKVELILGDYEIKEENGRTYLVKKKPKYPKTYEECCTVLSLGEDSRLYTKGYKASLIQDLQRLLICRDTYWKIIGEENGLDKPWEPVWTKDTDKFVIYTHDNAIRLNRFLLGHTVLAFPTKEIRDDFYENFKDLIEQCKELLSTTHP